MSLLVAAPRPPLLRLLGLNLAVASAVTLLLASVRGEGGPRLLLSLFVACLAYANAFGLPAAYLMAGLAPYFERLRFPFDWLSVAGGILTLTVAEVSGVMPIWRGLTGGGWSPPDPRGDLGFAVVVALSVGLAAYGFERRRAELRATREQLRGALNDVERLRDVGARASRDAAAARTTRITSRIGDRVQLIPLADVSHFVARDKLTYAVAEGRPLCVDPSLAQLERTLDPQRFVRVHRRAVVNLDWVHELAATDGGGLVVRLKDVARTELVVARDRARVVRQRLRG